jgi:hypothetical protein
MPMLRRLIVIAVTLLSVFAGGQAAAQEVIGAVRPPKCAILTRPAFDKLFLVFVFYDCYNLTKADRSSDLAALHLSEAEA